MNDSPQARWQRWRARLPQLSPSQQMIYGGALSIALLLFVFFVVPYLVPLGGPSVRPATRLADPNGIFLDLNGVQHYATHQPGSGPTVIFVHGFGGSVVDWRALWPYLDAYDVYALDLAGFGLSEKGLNLDLSHEAQAARVVALMDARRIPHAHIVAHDMGGNIALHLAQRYPDRVQSLALLAPALIYEPTTTVPAWVLQTDVTQRWARLFIRWIMPASTEINLRSAAERDEIVTPQLVEDYQRAYHTPGWDLALLALARDNSQSALPLPLQDTRTPSLIVWGAEDGWIAPQTATQIAADLPHAQRVMLPGVGHLPMLEAPLVLAIILLNYWSVF
ncbi:MAG: alpha/beta fold hydrolase [Anaerolineales bacterium]